MNSKVMLTAVMYFLTTLFLQVSSIQDSFAATSPTPKPEKSISAYWSGYWENYQEIVTIYDSYYVCPPYPDLGELTAGELAAYNAGLFWFDGCSTVGYSYDVTMYLTRWVSVWVDDPPPNECPIAPEPREGEHGVVPTFPNALNANGIIKRLSDSNSEHRAIELSFGNESLLNHGLTYRHDQQKIGYSRQNFGKGWFGNWDKSLRVIAEGIKISVSNGDGIDVTYVKQADGKWRTPAQKGWVLEQLKSIESNATGWLLKKEWVTEAYDSNGRLQSIITKNGKSYILHYAKTGDGLLTKVEASDNTSLNYEYSLAGNVSSVRDSEGRVIHYSYDSNNEVENALQDQLDVLTRNSVYIRKVAANDPAYIGKMTPILNKSLQTSISAPRPEISNNNAIPIAVAACIANPACALAFAGSIAYILSHLDDLGSSLAALISEISDYMEKRRCDAVKEECHAQCEHLLDSHRNDRCGQGARYRVCRENCLRDAGCF